MNAWSSLLHQKLHFNICTFAPKSDHTSQVTAAWPPGFQIYTNYAKPALKQHGREREVSIFAHASRQVDIVNADRWAPRAASGSYDGAVCKLSSGCDVCVGCIEATWAVQCWRKSMGSPQGENRLLLGAEWGAWILPLTLKMILAFTIFSSICLHSVFFFLVTVDLLGRLWFILTDFFNSSLVVLHLLTWQFPVVQFGHFLRF